jgi:hypothetical protein
MRARRAPADSVGSGREFSSDRPNWKRAPMAGSRRQDHLLTMYGMVEALVLAGGKIPSVSAVGRMLAHLSWLIQAIGGRSTGPPHGERSWANGPVCPGSLPSNRDVAGIERFTGVHPSNGSTGSGGHTLQNPPLSSELEQLNVPGATRDQPRSGENLYGPVLPNIATLLICHSLNIALPSVGTSKVVATKVPTPYQTTRPARHCIENILPSCEKHIPARRRCESHAFVPTCTRRRIACP